MFYTFACCGLHYLFLLLKQIFNFDLKTNFNFQVDNLKIYQVETEIRWTTSHGVLQMRSGLWLVGMAAVRSRMPFACYFHRRCHLLCAQEPATWTRRTIKIRWQWPKRRIWCHRRRLTRSSKQQWSCCPACSSKFEDAGFGRLIYNRIVHAFFTDCQFANLAHAFDSNMILCFARFITCWNVVDSLADCLFVCRRLFVSAL